MATLALIPQNTSFRWTLNETTYRTAIQTRTGFLQVKSVTNGQTEYDPVYRAWTAITDANGNIRRARVEQPAPDWWRPSTTMVTPFADFNSWYLTLPEGGSTTIEPYQKPIARKTKRLSGTTDVEKMKMLTGRFGISDPKYNYKQTAYIIISDTVKKIWCESEYIPDSQRTDPENIYNNYIRIEGDSKRYTTFAEIGDCLNADGKPKITVAYRKHTYPVANLF